jgi:MoaA/NifB/PqqE/SkfB family radical SAM enzyme
MGDLTKQSWDEVWNGRNARKLRRSMLRGDLRHCDRFWCPHIQNAENGIDDDNVVPHAERQDLEMPAGAGRPRRRMRTGPTSVGMHYDWSCNLACPTCRIEIQTVTGPAEEEMARLHEVVENELLHHANTINLTGTGDPFASKFLRRFLTEFEPARFPNIGNVHLHTNAIMWTPAMWERMPGLHDIPVSTDVSIDAARSETYEVVRRPGRWDRLMENMEFIMGLPNVHTVGISMTVSALNVDDVRDFYDIGRRLASLGPDKFFFVEYKRARRWNHHTYETWREQAIEHLDEATRERLVEQLRELEDLRAGGATPEIRSNLEEFLAAG